MSKYEITLEDTINKSINHSTHNFSYSYITNESIDLLLISVFELRKAYKHFRMQICLNCSKYFSKTVRKALYIIFLKIVKLTKNVLLLILMKRL